MSAIAERLATVRRAIDDAARRFARDPGEVALVAASKSHGADAIREACAAGQRRFGENYVGEAQAKQAELADLPIEWHFIGAIQSNKTAAIASAFDWVHTLESARIAERLAARRGDRLAPLNVLIQVNISEEASKHGVAPAALPALIDAVSALPRLRLRGLMSLPAPSTEFAAQRAAFAALAALAARAPVALDVLSMGTSDDFVAAIAEGATFVRLGTAVFGPRPARP